MAQIDSTLVIQPSLTTFQIHTPAGQGVTNNPAAPFVDPSHSGFSAGNPVKAVAVTVAGNVRFASPS